MKEQGNYLCTDVHKQNYGDWLARFSPEPNYDSLGWLEIHSGHRLDNVFEVGKTYTLTAEKL